MRRYVVFTPAAVLAVTGFALCASGQACTPEDALEFRSEWHESPPDLAFANDVVDRAGQAAILDRISTEIAPLFRQAYPEPRGTGAEGHASIHRVGPEIEGGPTPYGYTSLYMRWVCDTKTGEIERLGETGNWAYVYVNGLHSLLSEVGELTVDGERSQVWMLARRTGDFRGETLYEGWAGWELGKALVFHRPGEYPWKPISQQQYLEALARYWKEGADSTTDAMDEVIQGMEEQLAEIKRTMTGEMRDQLVAAMEEAIAQAKTQQGPSEQRLAAGVTEELRYISDYLDSHSAHEMQQPAFLPEGLEMGFRGRFWDESEGGQLLVQIDPEYFREDLPRDAPQLITLLWEWESESVASDRWRENFERLFPIERLKSMVVH